MSSVGSETPSQLQLKGLFTDTSLAIELDGYPELEHGAYHGENDGLPVYDDAPTTYVQLAGDSVRAITPDAARMLNLGEKILLSYVESCYVKDKDELELQQPVVSFTIHKPIDDPEFYLEAIAINHPSQENPCWTTERHTDYKDDEDGAESELLTGDAAVLALRTMFTAAEIAVEIDPEKREAARVYHLMRRKEFVALRSIVDNLSKILAAADR